MFHRSERLLLRPGWLEDAGELTARIADPAIVRNLSSVPWPYREEHAIGWLQRPRQPRLPSFVLVLPDTPGTPIVGTCGLHLDDRAGDGSGSGTGAELGYWIAREWWGRGLATEAARALLSIARSLGHRRLHSCHAVDNPASGRVLSKAGFAPTGRMRTIHSEGRGSDVAAAEYVIELEAAAGDDGAPMMPQAA